METLTRAYASMGRDFSATRGERVRAYVREKPKGKFGTHQYTPEDWGFTAKALRSQLPPYIEHFGVALEN